MAPRTVAVAAGLALALAGRAARAADDESARPPGGAEEAPRSRSWRYWHLGVEAGTDVPLSVGGRLSLEAPYGVRASTSLGVMPDPYVDLVNAVIVAADGYDERTAELVADTMENAMVWRLQLGWRPFRRWGFYVDAGYSLVSLSGDVNVSELAILALGDTPPGSDILQSFGIRSTLHLAVAELGYEWVVFDRLVIRAAAGFAGAIDSSTEIEAKGEASEPLVGLAQRAAERFDDRYTSYLYTPTVTFQLGYRFF
jgi:hypothetical protein